MLFFISWFVLTNISITIKVDANIFADSTTVNN